MTRKIFFLTLMLIGFTASAQTVNLTFTGLDSNNNHLKFNTVHITNLTRGWQETLTWPDTVLSMQNSVGIGLEESISTLSLHLLQNNPNPFNGTTDVNLIVVEKGKMGLDISDVNGRIVETQNFESLQLGTHRFRISLTLAGTYVMTAHQNGKTSSIKMLCEGGRGYNSIDYLGVMYSHDQSLKSYTTKPFVFGDLMEYVGYATINGMEVESERITQVQGASQTFSLHFPAVQMHLPSVTTAPVTVFTDTTAICGGSVTDDGGGPVIERGIKWGVYSGSESHTVQVGDSTGDFSCTLTGLMPNTTYSVRAYATNSLGTQFGDLKVFTTSYETLLPVVTTNRVTYLTDTTVLSGGTVFGASVTSKGVCWSTSPMPTIDSCHTDEGAGMGDFTSMILGLQEGTTYYVRAYATNHWGTTYGEEYMFITTAHNNNGLPCVGSPQLVDYDGNIYATMQIGVQCWMKENLRTTHFANGQQISVGGTYTSTTNAYRYSPNGNPANVVEYGYLYNWQAAINHTHSSTSNPSGVQGVCPNGWHLPSNAEWVQLKNYISSQSDYLCDSNTNAIAKALASTTGWSEYTGNDSGKSCYPGFNASDNNAVGFNAKPAGFYSNNSASSSFKQWALFWTSSTTFSGSSQTYYHCIYYNNAFVSNPEIERGVAMSVRCVRD